VPHAARTRAAEYISQGFVSEKTDIYAFAVVLVELLTSKLSIEVGEPADTSMHLD
jgi:hypothetical protein